MSRVASETEVENFLSVVFPILNESPESLIIVKRINSEDKTANFQYETGLTHDMICAEILALDCSNYSYTDKDRDQNRKEELWFFGKILNPPLIDESTEVYIKLKLQGRVICLSFHPSMFPMDYPYSD